MTETFTVRTVKPLAARLAPPPLRRSWLKWDRPKLLWSTPAQAWMCQLVGFPPLMGAGPTLAEAYADWRTKMQARDI